MEPLGEFIISVAEIVPSELPNPADNQSTDSLDCLRGYRKRFWGWEPPSFLLPPGDRAFSFFSSWDDSDRIFHVYTGWNNSQDQINFICKKPHTQGCSSVISWKEPRDKPGPSRTLWTFCVCAGKPGWFSKILEGKLFLERGFGLMKKRCSHMIGIEQLLWTVCISCIIFSIHTCSLNVEEGGSNGIVIEAAVFAKGHLFFHWFLLVPCHHPAPRSVVCGSIILC